MPKGQDSTGILPVGRDRSTLELARARVLATVDKEPWNGPARQALATWAPHWPEARGAA
jgi:hypothetical protein